MARIRTLKPEILTDEKTAALSDTEWRLFVSCIVMADDYGNFRASPSFLHSQAFWSASTSREDSRKALETLARVSLLSLYQVAGQQYGHVVGWDRHQRVDHPGKALCPGPEQATSTTCDTSSREPRENLAKIPETLAPDRDQEKDQDQGPRPRKRSPAARVESAAFTEFWTAYPRKVAKGAAVKAWPGDEHLPAILSALAWQVKGWADPKYIPHPATYLNQRRWEDERPRERGQATYPPLLVGSGAA